MTTSIQFHKTFFEALAIADAERIHTQMLCWIFNLPQEKLTTEEKSIALNKLFATKDNNTYQSIKAHTEFKNIDLIIEAEFADKSLVFILENKLKSSESPNQTNKYREEVKQHFEGATFNYCFLTLIEDKASDRTWHNASYKGLKEVIESIKFLDNCYPEHVFIAEYIRSLENLTSSFSEFCNNHQDFSAVFRLGSMRKYEKSKRLSDSTNRVERFISENQLETVFQKAFLKTLFNRPSILTKVEKKFKSYIEIGETRGNALIQLGLKTPYVGGFSIGLQMQGRTIKINLASIDYHKSQKEQITEEISAAFYATFYRKNNFNRKNHGKTKAYLSVSKQLPKELWQYNIQELEQIICEELVYCSTTAKNFPMATLEN